MSQQVRVEDLEVFTQLRIALLKFAQTADSSLSNADGQIARMHSWLENEQMQFWSSQLRKRGEAVTKAREAVRAKKLYKDAGGRTPSAAEEEKFLARCLAALQEAEEKLQNVRRWLPRLEKASDMYRGGVTRLQGLLLSEIPRGVALLERLSTSMDQYTQLEAPSTGMPEALPEPMVSGESMARPEEKNAMSKPAAEAAPSQAPKQQPAPSNQAPPQEDTNVHHG
jgi:hypothetical protein